MCTRQLPTIPPIIQRFEVEVLGRKTIRVLLNINSVRPESRLAVCNFFFYWIKVTILVKCFDTSTVIPEPTV
jgi:hypothetical protein